MNEIDHLTDCEGREVVKLKRKLGRGAFAEVYKGEIDGEPVAIKEFARGSQEELKSEIEIMKSLRHPNIVELISVVFHPEVIWVVMEFCEGGNFRNFIRGKQLSEKWACRYMQQISDGLRYMRTMDLVHRDLKPHNLLLSKDKRTLKIADFGFARTMGQDDLAGTMCGSPLYMAPEILLGHSYDAKADLWSVGVILYEMVCGTRPFRNIESIVELQKQVANAPIQFPRSIKITPQCKGLLARLLKKRPKERIEWDEFFHHEWFAIDWENPTPEFVDLPQSRAIRSYSLPQTSEAIPLSKSPAASSFLERRMIGNYVDQLSAKSPPPSSSTFLSDSNAPATSRSNSSSIKRSFNSFFSTGIGLLKDSFQGGL